MSSRTLADFPPHSMYETTLRGTGGDSFDLARLSCHVPVNGSGAAASSVAAMPEARTPARTTATRRRMGSSWRYAAACSRAGVMPPPASGNVGGSPGWLLHDGRRVARHALPLAVDLHPRVGPAIRAAGILAVLRALVRLDADGDGRVAVDDDLVDRTRGRPLLY